MVDINDENISKAYVILFDKVLGLLIDKIVISEDEDKYLQPQSYDLISKIHGLIMTFMGLDPYGEKIEIESWISEHKNFMQPNDGDIMVYWIYESLRELKRSINSTTDYIEKNLLDVAVIEIKERMDKEDDSADV